MNPVRSITITEGQKDQFGKKREIFFRDNKGYTITDMVHWSNSYSDSYKGKTITFPEGFDLLGIAVEIETDGTVKNLGFTIWRPPILA